MKTTHSFTRAFAYVCLALSLFGVSCCKGKGNDPEDPHKQDTTITPTRHDRPSWAPTDTTDLESTMTVTGCLPVALRDSAGTLDMVAAFADKECWGVTAIRILDSVPYFFLYINRPHSATFDSSVPLTLRYYCAKTKYIYVQRDTLEFVVDKQIGSISNPFIPTFPTRE